MFSFTKKIMIAACMVAFYPGQFSAFAGLCNTKMVDDSGDEAVIARPVQPTGQQLINYLPVELLQKIILSVDNANPRDLGQVCKFWRSFFYTNESIEKEEDVRYSGMMPLGQKLMRIWWYGRIYPNGSYDEVDDEAFQTFLNGVLQYRPDPNSDEDMIEFPISSLMNPLNGTFDLSGCGDAAEHLVITTSLSDFFDAHLNKIVIGIFPQKIATTASPFKDIMGNWDKNLAPVGIFWRWSGWNDLTWYDYLTLSDLEDISSRNLFKNWVCARRWRPTVSLPTPYCYKRIHRKISCLFLN